MECKTNVIILLSMQSVYVPAVAKIEFIYPCNIFVQLFLTVFSADLFQSNVDKHSEKCPVAVTNFLVIYRIKPFFKVFFRSGFKRLPYLFRCKNQTVCKCSHFNKTLVFIVAIAPVTVIFFIRTACYTGYI